MFDVWKGRPGPVAGTLIRALGVIALGALACLWLASGPSGREISLATSGLVMAVGASGFGFAWGQVGGVNLAYAATFGAGAYVSAILYTRHGVGFLPALALSAAAGGIVAALTALPLLRTKDNYFIILTFAIGEVAVVVATRLVSVTGGSAGITLIPLNYEVLGLRLTNSHDFLLVTVGVLTCVLLVLLFAGRSRWGATLRAVRENDDLATALGVAVLRQRIVTFALAGAIGGIGGQLYVYHLKYIDPTQFGINQSIFFLLMTLIGGRKYLMGPVIGAIVYTFLPDAIHLSPDTSALVFGLALIILILLLPDGVVSLPSRIAAAGRYVKGRTGESEPPALELADSDERAGVTQ
jgi:branched-chain amino acid transport system permease protein